MNTGFRWGLCFRTGLRFRSGLRFCSGLRSSFSRSSFSALLFPVTENAVLVWTVGQTGALNFCKVALSSRDLMFCYNYFSHPNVSTRIILC